MRQQYKLKETELGTFPEAWQLLTVEDIKASGKKAIISGPFGSNISSKYFVESGIPVIRGNNLSAGMTRFIDDGFVFVTPEKAKELDTWAVRGDIVFTAAGTLGQVGIIEDDSKYEKYVISNKQLRLRVNIALVRPLFVFYWFSSLEMVRYIQQRDTGSTIPLINLSVLKSLPIVVPPLEVQDEILNILDSVDKKMSYNRNTNITLEKIGQALFKHWFIDFEFPNERGKPYKSSGGKMVDSELGEIPQGWMVGTLADICDITMGQSPPGNTYNEKGDGLPFYQGITDFGFRFPSRRVFCTAPTRFAEEDDVLLSVRAPVGTFNVAEERCAIGRGLAALRLKEKHKGFLYYLLRTTRSEWEKFEAEGTVFGSVTKSDVHDFKVVIPPKPLLAKFALLIEGMEGKININEKQARNLTAIRDSVLPRLMSGRIRVPVG